MADRRPKRPTDSQWSEMIKVAREVRRRAHAPYSKFQVGAALLTADGEIIPGCNVENASYGLTICAERNAIAAGIARGKKSFLGIVITSESGVGPCGACRQVLAEFAPQMPVRLVRPRGSAFTETTVSDLLPGRFGPDDLDK